jgi:energy-coupling factor transport system ATP-binding protein
VRRSGPLGTVELVEAAVLADVAVLLIVAGWFLPVAGLFVAAAVVPFATLVVRHRFRALAVGAAAGSSIALLVLGPNLAFSVAGVATIGFVVGTAIKRGWGVVRTVGFALATVWAPAAVLVLAFLAIFRSARDLTLEQLNLQWTGTKRAWSGAVRAGDRLVAATHANPWVVVTGAELLAVALGVLLAHARRRIQRRVLLVLLGAYVVVASVLSVWTGVVVAAAAATGFVVARRGGRARMRKAIVRTWLVCAVPTALVLAIAREPLVRLLERQWRVVAAGADTLMDALFPLGDSVVAWSIAHWWVAAPIALLVGVSGIATISRLIATPIERRLRDAVPRPALETASDDGPPGPVPAVLEDVSFTYPESPVAALNGVTLTIPAGSYIGIVGNNGSGKSTLARILTGVPPTGGRVTRPGSPALGHEGGTAAIFQQPDSQVLGVRVREDVVWGLAAADPVDVGPLLALVGLSGFEERETSTLSGGELQRLAIAAALARRPKLIVSDESTAMVDPVGRDEIVRLFGVLVRQGITVVHITHRAEEVRDADLVCVLHHGRITATRGPDVVLADGDE